jgi:hypothetical protein
MEVENQTARRLLTKKIMPKSFRQNRRVFFIFCSPLAQLD